MRDHLQNAHDALLAHRGTVTAVIDALAEFLAAPFWGTAPAPVAAEPITAPAPARRVGRRVVARRAAKPVAAHTASKPVAKPKTVAKRPTPAQVTTPASGDVDKVLAVLRRESPLSPGAIATRTELLPVRARHAIAALANAGLVTVTGATNNRKVALSSPGRKVTGPAAVPRSSEAIGAAVDDAVLAKLRQGRATVDELLQVVPADAGADAQAKREALNRCLRRLSLKRAVVDIGAYWQVAA